MLENKAGFWKGSHEWNFRTKMNSVDLIYIEYIISSGPPLNITETLILEAKNGAVAFELDVEENKAEQLWKKGELNAEGYFTLENSKVPKILTAISADILTIQGTLAAEMFGVGDFWLKIRVFSHQNFNPSLISKNL